MEADLPKKSVLTVVAHSGDLYNYQPGTQDLLTSNNSEMGDFFWNSGRRTNFHAKLYKVYKGSGYHNQNMPPVQQYTTPVTILQPHNMSYNLQKPKTLKLH